MTPEQREKARHALGLPNERNRSYRNRYCAPANNSLWAGMVKAGLARIESVGGPHHDSLCIFALTKAAAQSVLAPGEALDPEDFAEG